MNRGSVEGLYPCSSAAPQNREGTGGKDYIQEEQASFRPRLGRTKWLYWGGGNHPTTPPLPPTYCPYPEGEYCGSWDLKRAPHLLVAAVEGPEGGEEG